MALPGSKPNVSSGGAYWTVLTGSRFPGLTHNRHSLSRARVIRRILEEGGSVRELRLALVSGNTPPQIGTPCHLPGDIVDGRPGSRGAIDLVALILRRWPSSRCGDQTFENALDRLSISEPASFAACLLAGFGCDRGV